MLASVSLVLTRMLGLGGSSSRINRQISSQAASLKRCFSSGVLPVNSSYRITPNAYTSLRVSTSSALIPTCSGAMYKGVPTMVPKAVYSVCSVSAWTLQRLSQTEVDHLGNRPAVVLSDQNVRRLDVAVDDPFLMGMLNRLANLHEQFQPIRNRHPPLVAVLREWNSADQLHDEIRASLFGGAAVKHLGDVRMVHQRQGLPLGFKPR